MKSKINNQAYNIAINDILFNHNNYTDLGEYTLEYGLSVDNIFADIDNPGVAALAVKVKLINNFTNKVEWGNVYFKKLSKQYHLTRKNTHVFKKLIEDLFYGPENEKMNFINKNEGTLFYKPYIYDSCISPETSRFFENLNGRDPDDGFPTISLNGKFPKNAIKKLDEEYNKLTSNDTIKRLTR